MKTSNEHKSVTLRNNSLMGVNEIDGIEIGFGDDDYEYDDELLV